MPAVSLTSQPMSGSRRLAPAASPSALLASARLLLANAVAALMGSPLRAFQLPVRVGAALRCRGNERIYAIPAFDGATIDRDGDVLLLRFIGTVYAFALTCPPQPADMARYSVHRTADGQVSVDLGTLFRRDERPGEWGAARVALGMPR